MTCHQVKQWLKHEGWETDPSTDHDALVMHVESCRRCAEAVKVARLSSALLQTLREETGPGPAFYPRLRARLARPETLQPDALLLQTWGFARRLIPALAVGVSLLAGVTLSLDKSRSSVPVQVGSGTDVYAFSLEEVNLPGVVGQPSRDQMLAFVLTRSAGCEVRGARCEEQALPRTPIRGERSGQVGESDGRATY